VFKTVPPFKFHLPRACILASKMKKRKEISVDLEGNESKRRKKLEDAKRFIEKKGASISEAAKKFEIGRNSLGTYMRHGFQKLGRPALLCNKEIESLRSFLSALDTAHLQQSVKETANIIQSFSGSDQKPSPPTVRKYVHEAGLFIRKARTADQGRLRVIESIEDFVHYYDVLEEKLNLIAHDPRRIFNVDEVGIQVAERSIHLITGRQYLNKNLNKTSIHVTMVLCTSPGQNGIFMRPHFLFQQPENSRPHNLLCGTHDSTSESNTTGYQDEHTWKNWMSLFICWKNQWLLQNGYQPQDPVILLLDGHYSHLDIGVIYTAAKNSVEIVCMLAHATHLVQPNDKLVNKRFKQNLDDELSKMASNDLTVENFDIAYLCEKALDHENMKGAIISSYRQV